MLHLSQYCFVLFCFERPKPIMLNKFIIVTNIYQQKHSHLESCRSVRGQLFQTLLPKFICRNLLYVSHLQFMRLSCYLSYKTYYCFTVLLLQYLVNLLNLTAKIPRIVFAFLGKEPKVQKYLHLISVSFPRQFVSTPVL